MQVKPSEVLLVDMVDIKLHEDPVHRGPAQMMPAVRQALFAGILSGNPTLLEPISLIQVRVPASEMGNVTGLLSSKRGSIRDVEQEGPIVNIQGMLPVAEISGYQPRDACSDERYCFLADDL